ncbi:MAG TPA: hypothetical protein VFA07_01880 [Chthonomonadaceae bacterium]|nr:hypothetical protein [Chthonomonadaceae bacterium]
MDETVQSQPKTAADYKTAFSHLLAEMDRVGERIDKDRAEIDRLKIETQVIKARISENLSRLQEQINNLDDPHRLRLYQALRRRARSENGMT